VTRLVTGTLPNLVNGVSQQAPALRLATQGEKQENFYSTIVEGLKDRPPSEFVAKLLDTLPDGTFTHVINRDKTERYIVIFDSVSGTLKVWDFLGVQKTVNAPSGWGYLSGLTDPQTQLAALTVADYTFFVNTDEDRAMRPTVASSSVRSARSRHGRQLRQDLHHLRQQRSRRCSPSATPDGSGGHESPPT
jgi:hypothetical protein